MTVKVTYLGIRSAHERVWLVEWKPIWLPRAYLTRGNLEPARGNLHVCKLLRDLTIIQIRTVTAECMIFCSECICPTNVLHRKEREGRKEGEDLKERERKKEGTATKREEESVTLTTVSSLELIQESVSCCLLRPLLTTMTNHFFYISRTFLPVWQHISLLTESVQTQGKIRLPDTYFQGKPTFLKD